MCNVIQTYNTTTDKLLKKQLLSLYTNAAAGSHAQSILQARVVFDCSGRQVWQSKLHGSKKGAGTIVTKDTHEKNRLSKEQCDCLRKFSVNTANVHIPAHSSTTDPKFLRKFSWKKLMARLNSAMDKLGVP